MFKNIFYLLKFGAPEKMNKINKKKLYIFILIIKI